MRRPELIAGLALALLLRLGFGVHMLLSKATLPPHTTGEYERIAINVLDRGEYAVEAGVLTAIREPGFPLFVAGSYALLGRSQLSVIVIHVVLSLLTIWMIYRLGLLLFGERCARVAFWCAVFYPYFIYYSAYQFRETVLSFLVIAVFYFLAVHRDVLGVCSAGISAGLLVLTNAVFVPAMAMLAPLLWVYPPKARRLRGITLFFCPVVLLLSVWVVRNWAEFGVMIPGSTHVGTQLHVSLIVPPEVLGTPEQSRIMEQDPFLQTYGDYPEALRHKLFLAESLRIMASRPIETATGCLLRSVKLWRVMPHVRQYTHDVSMIRLVALFSDGWLVPFALLGLFFERKSTFVLWGFAMVLFVVTMTYSISNAPIRYRVPLMPVVLLMAARGSGGVFERIRSKIKVNFL